MRDHNDPNYIETLLDDTDMSRLPKKRKYLPSPLKWIIGGVTAGVIGTVCVGNLCNSGGGNNAFYSNKPSEPVIIAPIQSCDDTAVGTDRPVLIQFQWLPTLNTDHYRVQLKNTIPGHDWEHWWAMDYSTVCYNNPNPCLTQLANVAARTDYLYRVAAYRDANETPELTAQSQSLEFRTLDCP
jgi:hypothetical protein